MSWRQAIVLAGWLIMAASTWADPDPFVKINPEWGQPEYDPPRGMKSSETWSYMVGNRGVLMLSRHYCSPCEPISRELVDLHNANPEDVAMLIDHHGTPAIVSLGKAHSGAHITTFGINTPDASYGFQLVINDGGPAEESFELQQSLLRLVEQFRP